jgi:alanine racemase
VWAVVKADGYGHGAPAAARAALEAGAEGLCVALVQEGVALRQSGIVAPVLVLSEQPVDQLDELLHWRLTPTVYRSELVDELAQAAERAGDASLPVHVKVDTGMHRAGASPDEVIGLLQRMLGHPELEWSGLWTHLARADETDVDATARQLDRFDTLLAELAQAGFEAPLVHAANSAGGLAHPAARRDLVRAGIAIYGLIPGPGIGSLCTELEPALSLRARVSRVQRTEAGEGISYGHRTILDRATTIATVPIGYADGVPRRLSQVGGEVLLGGRRRPIVGHVTMDQLMVACGDDEVRIGDEVVLIGTQDGDRITADDWASALGTINYEIVCGLSPRLPRRYVDAGEDSA